MKLLVRAVLLFVVLLIAYLLFWPVPVNPVAWKAPVDAGYTGVFNKNNKLALFSSISLDGLHGAEAVVGDGLGGFYSATHEGDVVYWSEGDDVATSLFTLDGRPLGMLLEDSHTMWIADAFNGLVKVENYRKADRSIDLVLTEVAGKPLLYIDDLDIAPSGKIYFSDASTRFGAKNVGDTLAASLLDIMEHSASARLVEYDPVTGETVVVADQFNFLNGIAIEPGGEFLLAAETGSYRIWKVWLTAEKYGQKEVILDNLPGFPDNIHTGESGRFWVGLTSPRSESLDQLSNAPFVRKMVQRLPSALRPLASRYGMVIAIDGDGAVLANLQAPEAEVYMTTGAWESKTHLYVSSLTAPFVAKYEKSSLGL